MINQWVALNYIMEVNCGEAAPQAAPINNITATSIHDIYPNPANDFITARVILKKGSAINVSIYDARGQVFLSEKKQLPKGASNLNFNIHDLPAGMYILQLGNGEYKRFAKMN